MMHCLWKEIYIIIASGSHGEGSLHETETPYVAWGAGISHPLIQGGVNYSDSWRLSHIQRVDMKQADMAPLMSILLGISIPVNSVVFFFIFYSLNWLNLNDWDHILGFITDKYIISEVGWSKQSGFSQRFSNAKSF